MAWRVLPEHLVEDVIEYHFFVIRYVYSAISHMFRTDPVLKTVRQSPKSLELSGRNEMLIWCLAFLTSTWYIKNPFLKAKIVEVLFFGCWNWGEQRSVLTTLLNTHSVALQHLMPALMHFYIGRTCPPMS